MSGGCLWQQEPALPAPCPTLPPSLSLALCCPFPAACRGPCRTRGPARGGGRSVPPAASRCFVCVGAELRAVGRLCLELGSPSPLWFCPTLCSRSRPSLLSGSLIKALTRLSEGCPGNKAAAQTNSSLPTS